MRRKLAVILAADVAAYSRLVAEDEDDALRRLNAGLNLFRELVAHHGGRIFNTAGDAVLAEFPSAIEAFRCAIEAQESLKTRNVAYAPSRRLHFRVGLHIGDVFEEDGNLLGDGVNVAARLEGIAPVGGICVSRIMHDALAGKLSFHFTNIGEQALKNIPAPVHAFVLPIAETSAPGDAVTAAPPPKPLVPQRAVMAVAGVLLAVLTAGSMWLFRPAAVAPSAGLPTAIPATVAGSGPAKPAAPDTANAQAEAAAVKPERESAPLAPPPASTPVRDDAKETAAPEQLARPVPSLSAAGQTTHPAQPAAGTDPEAERLITACRQAKVAEAAKACAAAAASTALDPARHAEAQALLGNALRDAGDLAGAVSAYNRSIELHASADAFIGRGIVHFQRRELDSAVLDFDEALKLAPESGEALNNRAWTRYRLGNPTLALKDADRAVSLLPQKSYAWDTRAHIHEALGNKELAIRDYRGAINADPTAKSSQEGLKRLLAKP